MDPGDGTSPHHRFSQRGYKGGNTSVYKTISLPIKATTVNTNNNNNNNNNNINDNKSSRKWNEALIRTVRFGGEIRSSHRNLYPASSLQEYLRYQDNAEWENIESVIIRLFQKKSLATRQLNSLRENVKELWSTSRVGPLLFDFYLKQALNHGVAEIRNRLTNLKELELIQKTEESWSHFYSEALPTLQAIFFPMKPKHSTLRHTILICFRDGVLLKINIKEALESLQEPPPAGIVHMLLILQSIHDTYPPNDNYLNLERLVAMVVSPYMGYRGIYEGKPEPVLHSKEPELNRWNYKRKRQTTSLRWSISSPNRTMDTLEEMFHNVYTKENDNDE